MFCLSSGYPIWNKVPGTITWRMLFHDPMDLIWPAIVFAAAFAAGWLVRWIVLRVLHAWTSRANSRPGLILISALRGPLIIWSLILALHMAVQLSPLPENAATWVSRLLLVLWILSVTMMSVRIAGNLVRYYGADVQGALPVTTLSQTLAQLFVCILGSLWLLRAFRVDITPVLTALGVGGLAVALALQDTLSNLFSGFYISVARQVRLGDYIKLNTGEAGYVTDIGWRSVTLRELSNNLIIIPNAKLGQANVTNYYLPDKRLSVSLQVPVAFDSNLDQVERILMETAGQAIGKVQGLLADPAPSVSFDPGFGDFALTYTLGFQVAEFADQFAVRQELRKRILRRFREEGVRIPFPTRTIHMPDGAK
jgi:small-conductance mechanosensitive channel